MKTIRATVPCVLPPTWAVLERALFATIDQAVAPYLAKYTNPDGTLIWGDVWKNGRDGGDDVYESFVNWPLYYLLGGGDHILPLAHREWDALTAQLEKLGPVLNGYERGYDQFHQSECYTYFYTLCMADPTNAELRERAIRFAGLYMGEDSSAANYDPEKKLVRAPHNGSGGPRWGVTDGEPKYGWSAGMARYGLPFSDIPGVSTYDDLRNPDLARRMGEAMQERMGRGDVAANLGVTSLITNAFALIGDERYRRWVLEYVDGWWTRAKNNDGLLPDNVGLSGNVGEYLGGRWFGGLYGWTWPHGFYNLEMAAIVAGANTLLLTGDQSYLNVPRNQLFRIAELGRWLPRSELQMSLAEHWVGQLDGIEGNVLVHTVPYRYGQEGWFDYQPLSSTFPAALWSLIPDANDQALMSLMPSESTPNAERVVAFRNKEDAGHEAPWFSWLHGRFPAYPEAILQASLGQVYRRLEQIRQDTADLRFVSIHHWQQLNPVTTEALVQLTLGSPQPIYNGGLLHTSLRYFDDIERRPGLPKDVAALVDTINDASIRVQLVNLSGLQERAVIVQAGAFAEHEFGAVQFDADRSEYPGGVGSYAAPALTPDMLSISVDENALRVVLPPATQLQLDIQLRRFRNPPTYTLPWLREDPTRESEQTS